MKIFFDTEASFTVLGRDAAEKIAIFLHQNFYENWMPAREVELAVKTLKHSWRNLNNPPTKNLTYLSFRYSTA